MVAKSEESNIPVFLSKRGAIFCLRLQILVILRHCKPHSYRVWTTQLLEVGTFMQSLPPMLRCVGFVLLALVLGSCASTDVNTLEVLDGAPKMHIDISQISDAVPRPHKGPHKFSPYSLNGIDYQPMKSANGYIREGIASWYGTKFHGKQTANGEVYDIFKMTGAHKTLPLPSYVKVTNLDNNRSVVLRVNDRGPFHEERLLDVSYVAAKKLGFAVDGTSKVKIEGIDSKSFLDSPERHSDESFVYLQLAAFKSHHSAQVMRQDVFDKLGVSASVISNENKVNLL
ncbi:MAG: septal ring lytic transglycosylase RlpA family protein [Candidatus Endonucleobacter bathymodioli]|uniref:Endolytic peptidoglycan transglycosylase RlpA n=1 Tax=Candidatus Endonucleibacter bathymodioli TaxID=539814 RepID=A0AA90SSK3_9GAMM|nr:septal ring lytic transglycosylase RlpA family protein [Candidatus Endonucleobacter bathymodioli]